MSISKFKIKEGLDLDGLVLTNNNGTLYADGSAVGVTYIDSVSTDFDVTNGQLVLGGSTTIATKSYVDATAQGLDVKDSVAVAVTTSQISDWLNTPGSSTNVLDGVTLAVGDRVLVKSGSAAGIRVVTEIVSGFFLLEDQAADSTFDTANGEGTLTKGSFTFVEHGTDAGRGFVVSTIDVSAGVWYNTWTQFSATGSYITSVGTNLSVGDGNSGTTLGELNLGANVLTTDSLGSGLFYSPTGSTIDVQLGTGLITNGSNQIEVDRLTVDTWYEPAGAIDALDTDDIEEGSTNLYFTDSRARTAVIGQSPSASTYLSDSGSGYIDLNLLALETQLDSDGYAKTADIPATTDDLPESGSPTNLYFTDSRAVTAVSNVLGSGLFYSPTGSTIDVQLGTGLIANGSNQIEVDRLTVDTWYDAAGAASTAETNANSYTDTAVGNIDLSSKQNVLTAGNGIDITNDTISLDSDVIVTSVALTDATTGVSAGSDVLGNATNTTYAMGSAQTVYTFATGTKTADIFVQIVNASGDTRTSKITAVFNGGSAPIWTEYGIVDSGTAMATTVSFDSYAFKINITGSSTYAVHGVTTFLS